MHTRKEKFWIIGLLTLVGLIIRLAFLFASDFVIDADEAIVGLMARHISLGQDFPVFYYGQEYMGSLEAFGTALIFKIFGQSSATLKLFPLILSTCLIPTTYALGRAFGLKFGARIAALFIAMPPQMLLVWSLKSRGGYVELLLIGALAIITSLNILRDRRPSILSFAAVGFLFGLGFWTNFQIIYFAVVAGLVILSRLFHPGFERREIKRCFSRGIAFSFAFFVLGSLPFWIHNINNHFGSFKFIAGSTGGGIISNASGLFGTGLPILLGARRVWQSTDVFPYSTLLASLTFGFIFLVYLISRLPKVIEALTLRFEVNSPLELLLGFLLGGLIIFVASSFGVLAIEPRYLIPLYLGIYVIAGAVIESARKISRSGSAIIIILVSLLNISSAFSGGIAVPGEPFVAKEERVSKTHVELIDWLTENNISWIRTNYWIGYRLAFETAEKVRFTIFDKPRDTRIESWKTEAELDESRVPFVVVPSQALVLEAALKALKYNYSVIDKSGYKVFYNLQKPSLGKKLDASRFKLISENGSDSLTAAIDGDLKTRWGSAHHQEPGLKFTIEFVTPVAVTGLRYQMGDWATDYPRGLEIRVTSESGEQTIPLRAEDIAAINYFRETTKSLEVPFSGQKLKAITLILSGNDPVFDWSMAELELFESEQVQEPALVKNSKKS